MHNQSIAFTSLKTRESSQAKQQAMAEWKNSVSTEDLE